MEKIKINRIFLDIDGVLRDWEGGVFKWFECEPVPVINWGTVCNHICKEYGISEQYFWDKQTINFWIGLKMYPYSQKILSLLPIKKTCLLTSPTLNNAGFSQQWIRNNIPEYFNNKQYIIGPAKQFCASPDSLLIDDADVNIEKFKEAGGNAILFPQPWNKNRDLIERRLDYLKMKLNQLYDF